MIADQKHSSDSIASEQEVIRYTKILAQAFGLNEQNAEVYSVLSSENRALAKGWIIIVLGIESLKKELNY